jgi:hypothetical protein
MARKIPSKSSRCMGSSRSRGRDGGRRSPAPGSSRARHGSAPSRRTCAPCGTARSLRRRTRAPSWRRGGVSALVRTRSLRNPSAHSMSRRKWSEISGSTVGTRPRRTRPVAPSSVIQSPSSMRRPCASKYRSCPRISMSRAPTTQGLPIPRATTAAWDVMPPREVTIPWRDGHSGEVVGGRLLAHQDHRSPASVPADRFGRLEHHDPGRGARRGGQARGQLFGLRAGIEAGWSCCSSCSGSRRFTAVSAVIRPSSTISTAMRIAAAAVRFPPRVWSR